MSWNKQTKKFLGIAVVALVLLAVVSVIAQPQFISNAGQGIIDWACSVMGLSQAPQIF